MHSFTRTTKHKQQAGATSSISRQAVTLMIHTAPRPHSSTRQGGAAASSSARAALHRPAVHNRASAAHADTCRCIGSTFSVVMASSTAAAAPAGPAPAPPAPAPTSLLDLPQAWLLRLATSSAFDRQHGTLVALFRTCTFLRDAVLRHRTASTFFTLPFEPGDWPHEVERLCTVARRSSSVRLEFWGPKPQEDEEGEEDEAVEEQRLRAEPHITHLLVCAMAELGGEQPLACIKEIDVWVSDWTRRACARALSSCP